MPNLTSLTLKDCGLREVDRIAELTKLEYLDISSPDDQANDYSPLAALTELKYLDMSWQFDSVHTEQYMKDGSFINSLTKLEELNIYNTGINNYLLSNLPNLKKLTINKCSADEILKQLCEGGSISTLEELIIVPEKHISISDNGLKNYLSKAVNLKYLYLDVNDLTTLEGLGNLQSLEGLNINNRVAFDLPLSTYDEISKLKNLTKLTIAQAPYVDNGEEAPDDYDFLNELTSLKTLTIGVYDGMAIECFSGLKNLETLCLCADAGSDTEVDIKGIEKLESLKELYKFGIHFKSSAPLDDLDDLTVQTYQESSDDIFDWQS